MSDCYNIIYVCFMHVVTQPVIIEDPQSQLVSPKDEVSFTVVAMGEDLRYQWVKANDVIMDRTADYSGIQTSTLTMLSAHASDEGEYFCVVFNIAGFVTSARALLQLCKLMSILYRKS